MLNGQLAVRRVRIVSGQQVQSTYLQEGAHRGFGSLPGENLDSFHDRMYDLPPLEAMMYELEVAISE